MLAGLCQKTHFCDGRQLVNPGDSSFFFNRDIFEERYQDNYAGANHGFTSEGFHFSAVNYPRATNTFLNGINKAGAMVGGFVAPSGNNGFELEGGKFRLLRFRVRRTPLPTALVTKA
jgi:hypothetical protein